MADKYQEFVQFLFNRNELEGDWRFDINLVEPDLSAEETVEFIQRMLENCESELSGYSNWQLGLGMTYIFNNSCSDLSFKLRDGPVDIQKRIDAILSLKTFFKEYLNKRCVRSLSHLSEEGNELNGFCYMLWDITPLAYCERMPDKNEIYTAIAKVMKYSLSLDNIACIESGLHGLGHLKMYYNDASNIVRKYINSQGNIESRLLTYAKNAEQGSVL